MTAPGKTETSSLFQYMLKSPFSEDAYRLSTDYKFGGTVVLRFLQGPPSTLRALSVRMRCYTNREQIEE